VKPYSLRRRLVVVMVAALGVALAVIASVLYAGVRDAAWQQHDDSLLARARALSALAEHDDEGYEFEVTALEDAYVELWLRDGRILAPSPGPRLRIPTAHIDNLYAGLPADTTSERGIVRALFFELDLPDGRAGHAVAIRFHPRDETGTGRDVTLILAKGVGDVTNALASIRDLFIVVGLIAMLAIAALVWWITGRALRPLADLGRSIDRIDDRSLTRRLPLDDQPVELVAPVRKLNDLLARLETSFARERQFTADVSHELRTPLAGLRTVLEVTALTDRTTPEYKQALSDAHAITLQLGAIVDNLLVLARLDAGQLPVTPSDVDLRELVDECWKPHATTAAARSLTFKNQLARGTVLVDREKLRVIVGNLLANAAEYTEAGGWVEVNADGALIAVVDSGPALPDERKIFDRLWRGDASRTGTGVHCGIGLALARSLAEHMRLSLTAANQSDGSVRFAISGQ
jgi:signal transduction histidine kinase